MNNSTQFRNIFGYCKKNQTEHKLPKGRHIILKIHQTKFKISVKY